MLITKQELKYLGIWIGKIFTYLILLMSPVIAVQTIEKLSFTSFEEPAPAQVIRETGQKMVIMSLSYENIFRVIILQFMDAYDFDVRSVKKSCVHIVNKDNKMIPFETMNLFYRDEKENYLKQLIAQENKLSIYV